MIIPQWLDSIWKEEYEKIHNSRTFVRYLTTLQGESSILYPEYEMITYPENLRDDFFKDHPESAIIFSTNRGSK